MYSSPKTVVVLGAAYGGCRASQILAAGLPESWRVLLIDRNSHMNNVYIFPRLSVLPGHEHKAFIPLSKVFLSEDPTLLHRCLQATVTSIRRDSITLSRAFPEHGLATTVVPYDYMIYALGSLMPPPLDLWGTDPADNIVQAKPGRNLPVYRGTKSEGIAWMKEHQKIVEDAPTILVVGGGALGIQFATDIAAIYSEKKVTLLHSRKRLLPRFDEAMHDETLKVLETMENVDVILGERLDMSSVKEQPVKHNELGQRIVRTVTGREIASDLLLMCTGQTPNTGLLKEFDPATVNPDNSLARILRTMQLSVLTAPLTSTGELEDALKQVIISEAAASIPTLEEPPMETPYPHIFVVGDAADAFGAIAAGHNAYYQGEVAARNILHLIRRSEGASGEDEPLEQYTPGPPAIKVSLGLDTAVFQSQGIVGRRDGASPDLGAALMWPAFGFKITDDDQMYE
ncbi:Apoptosis-inducing factor like protein [Termitomyces sp. T112]|nr:Apoptosis-inducing factor like protein [Termitomyces sp. T112]